MATFNPDVENEILEANALSLNQTTTEVASFKNFLPSVIHLDSTEFANFGTVIQADESTINNLLKESVDWDKLIETEPIEIVERTIIEELENDNISPEVIIDCFKTLITISESFDEPKLEILYLVLSTIPEFPTNVHVQIWGLKALYCLKAYVSYNIHETQLVLVFQAAINAAKSFELDCKLYTIALQIMNDLWQCFQSHEIKAWESVSFTMNALVIFNNKAIHSLALQILSKVLSILPKMIQKIGSVLQYRTKLYGILDEKTKLQLADNDLKIVLDMWIEIISYVYCQNCFIFEKQVHLITQLLDEFPDENIIIEKALSLIEQMGRHDESNDFIMTKETILKLLNYIRNENMHISFLSVTILVSRISDKLHEWKFGDELLHKIYRVIKSAVFMWDSTKKSEMIKFESLKPLIKILISSDETAFKLYAAWTINYLCSQNSKHYIHLLIKEKLLQDLEDSQSQTYECEEIKLFLTNALTHVKEEKNEFNCSVKPKFSLDKLMFLLNKTQTVSEDDLEVLKSANHAEFQKENKIFTNFKKFLTDTPFGPNLLEYIQQISVDPNPSSDYDKLFKIILQCIHLFGRIEFNPIANEQYFFNMFAKFARIFYNTTNFENVKPVTDFFELVIPLLGAFFKEDANEGN